MLNPAALGAVQVQTGSDGRELLAACILFLSTDCCSSATADPDKSSKVGRGGLADASRMAVTCQTGSVT